MDKLERRDILFEDTSGVIAADDLRPQLVTRTYITSHHIPVFFFFFLSPPCAGTLDMGRHGFGM